MSAFAADTFSGLGSGSALSGRLASDGVTTWSGSGWIGSGAGSILPTTTGGTVVMSSPGSNANQVITWSWVVPSGGVAYANGYSSTFLIKYGTGAANNNIQVQLGSTASQLGFVISEFTGTGNVAINKVTSALFTVTGTINCTLTISKGVATIVMSGGTSQTYSIPLALVAGRFGMLSSGQGGQIQIFSTTPANVTSTAGMQIGPIVASNTATAATSYALIPPYAAFSGATPIISGKYPTALPLAPPNTGYQSVGLDNLRLYQLILDGVAPAGGFVWTPTMAGTLYTPTYNASLHTFTTTSTVTIPAGQDSAAFAFAPAAGTIANVNVAGTNNCGFTNPSAFSQPVRSKLAMFEGDSTADPNSHGGPMIAAIQTAIGTNWTIITSAIAFSVTDDGTGTTALSVLNRSKVSQVPWHDGARTQECAIVWCGTNDIAGGVAASTCLANLATIVGNLKTGGIANVIVGTMMSRNITAPQEAQRQLYNSGIRSAYGVSGADPTVGVADIGNDPHMGQPTDFSDTTYFFGDGVHENAGLGSTTIAGYFSALLNALPASQGTPPSAPASLAVHAGDRYASLSWPPVAGATGYSVFRGTSPGGESATAIATGITGTGYVDTGLTDGTAYYYTVKAVGTGGTSSASPEASGTPAASARKVRWFPGLGRHR